MASLRERLDEAKSAILDGQSDRAVDLCLGVLATYPKHSEAHCLLGEALREKGLPESAEQVFLRGLSADPENLIARWALSILLEERGDEEGALHQLERAFELNPGHAELESELARLSRRPVVLNRAALARIYARGELWEKVIDELGVVMQRNPGRLEVMVLMAEALWKLGRTDESATLCQQILDDSPDCLKANIILGHILSKNGGEARARAEALLAHARAIDPESRVEAGLSQRLEKDYSPGVSEMPPVPRDRIGNAGAQDEPSSLAVTPQPYHSLDPGSAAEAAASEEQIKEEGSEWDDLLGDDVALDDDTSSRLAQAIARLTSSRQAAPGRSVLASLDSTGRSEDEPASSKPEATRSEATGGDLEVLAAVPSTDSLEVSPTGLMAEPQVGAEARGDREPAMVEAVVGEPESIGSSLSGYGLECLQRVREHPEDHFARLNLALALQGAGELRAAVEEFDLVLRSAPELVDRVIEGLQSLLRTDPSFSVAHRVLGDAYLKVGRYEAARNEYDMARK